MGVHHGVVRLLDRQVQRKLGGRAQRRLHRFAVHPVYADQLGGQLVVVQPAGTDGDQVADPDADVAGGTDHQTGGAQPAARPGHLLPRLGQDHFRNVRSQHAQHEPDSLVQLIEFVWSEAAGEVAQPRRVNGPHLIDQDAGGGAVHVDLKAEGCGLRTGRGGRYDQCGEADHVTLHRHGISRSTLLVAGAVLRGPKPVQVTTH